MKNLPRRIEVIIEPELWAIQGEVDAVRMTIRVQVNGIEKSSEYIEPYQFDFFMSHFDLAIESAKQQIKKELDI